MKVFSVAILVAVMVVSVPVAFAQDLPQNETTDKKYQKMDSRLAELYDATSSRNMPISLSNTLALSQDEQRVQVVLVMNDADAEIPQDLGIVVETTYEDMIQVNVPITNLEAVSLDSNVLFIQVPQRPVPGNESNPLNHQSGHVLREGAQRMMADRLHTAGYTGNGIKVAVIDSGFDINNPEISGNIANYTSFRADKKIHGKGNEYLHGTASAEVVVDVAPDVQLYLYNYDELMFDKMVDHIISKNVDIITMSLVYPWYGELANGRSDISMKANQARNSGILWFNSAGNYAQSHWEGRFYDPDGNGWHNFQGGDETINVSVPSYRVNEPMWINLSWWGSPSQDYNLHLYKGNTKVGSGGTNTQPNAGPYEDINYVPQDTTTLHIKISKRNATVNSHFQLFSNFNFDEHIVSKHSVTVPADATGVVAVGAYNWEVDTLDSYSSRGPTFDGTIKPDLSASTCATTSVDSYYCGTSGASPHAAGAAALIMDKYSDLNPKPTANDVQNLLEATVKSRHAKSNQDGTGRVDLGMFVNSNILALNNSNSGCTSDNSCFFPKTLRVSRGDIVTWTNADNRSAITITGSTGSNSFTSGQIPYKGSYKQTFTTDGTFSYSDGLHPWATGQIIVGTGATSSPPTFSSASITGPNQVTMLFNKPVTISQNAFTAIELIGAPSNTGTRQATSVAGSGTQTIIITFDGQPVSTDATATIRFINNRITDQQGNALTGAGFATATDGQQPRLVSIKITGPNQITAEFTENVRQGTRDGGVADGFLGFRIGEVDYRNTSVNIPNTGAKYVSITFGGTKTASDATGSITITSDIEDIAGNRLTRITDQTVEDGQAPILYRAEFGEGRYMQIAYSENTAAPRGSYSALSFGGDTRDLTDRSHTGDRHHVNYTGSVVNGQSATMSVGSDIKDRAENALVVPNGMITVYPNENPKILRAAVTAHNEVTVTFSEPVKEDTVDKGKFSITVQNAGAPKVVQSISGGNTATIILKFANNSFETSTTGTMRVSSGITDMLDKPLGAISSQEVLRLQLQSMPDATISGKVCVTAQFDATCDTGDQGLRTDPPYMMYIERTDKVGDSLRSTEVNPDTGEYRFDGVTPGIQWNVQTLYYPPGHVTFEDDSWFKTGIVLEADQTETFDVAFYRSPPADLVTLQLRTYIDANNNGIRDQGEDGMAGLPFVMYTYVAGKYETIVTDARGSVDKNDILPANWAILEGPPGWFMSSIDYQRTDDTSDVEYHSSKELRVFDPAPGSVHTMKIGLWRP